MKNQTHTALITAFVIALATPCFADSNATQKDATEAARAAKAAAADAKAAAEAAKAAKAAAAAAKAAADRAEKREREKGNTNYDVKKSHDEHIKETEKRGR